MDIEMCFGHGCNLKHKCLRYTAEKDENQKYFNNSPIWDNKCSLFLRDIRKQ